MKHTAPLLKSSRGEIVKKLTKKFFKKVLTSQAKCGIIDMVPSKRLLNY